MASFEQKKSFIKEYIDESQKDNRFFRGLGLCITSILLYKSPNKNVLVLHLYIKISSLKETQDKSIQYKETNKPPNSHRAWRFLILNSK